MTDFASATYVSVLESLTTGSLTGTFTCIVENSRGSSNRSIVLDSKYCMRSSNSPGRKYCMRSSNSPGQ